MALERLSVLGEDLYSLSIYRHGTSVYHLHGHFRARSQAESELKQLRTHLNLPRAEFEVRYQLDGERD